MDALGYISAEEVRQALRQIYRSDAESNLQNAILESLSDELRPVDEKGRWKPSPLLVLTVVLLCTLIGAEVQLINLRWIACGTLNADDAGCLFSGRKIARA